MESHFHLGDIVTDRLGKSWSGTIVGLEFGAHSGHRAVIRVTGTNSNTYADFWYPISWIKHVAPPINTEAAMDDTREYLQAVAGGQ